MCHARRKVQPYCFCIRLTAHNAKRDIRLIEQRGQSADRPILASMPEPRYLKCFILQVL
jgi:23S rRNA (cytosine1962-C5)-methyltransferase